MNDPAELFARLTCQLEDLHGLTIEGQCTDQPTEVLSVLATSIGNGLQNVDVTLAEIMRAIGGEHS